MKVNIRDAITILGLGSRGLEKGICTDYDDILMSEFKLKGSGCLRNCGA